MPRRVKPKAPLQRTFIKAWREYRNLSQDKLVSRLVELTADGSFSKATLSRIETGDQAYTQETLEILAEALNCTPADLLVRDPKSPVWSIMDTVKDLPPHDQEQIASIVETFRKAS